MSDALRTGGGQRQTWADVPPRTRGRVEARLGAPVVRADSQIGGFSPGVAARLTTGTGETVFLKAVSPVPNPDSPRFHRQEARVAAHLPLAAPVPRLRWSFDEGPGGWVVLVFDVVDGRMPALPWDDAELGLVLAAIDGLAETLTPSPVRGRSLAASQRLGSSDSPTGRTSGTTRHPTSMHGPAGTAMHWSRSRPTSTGRQQETRCSTWTYGPITSSSPSVAWWWSTGPVPRSARRAGPRLPTSTVRGDAGRPIARSCSPGAIPGAQRVRTRCGRLWPGLQGSSPRCHCCHRRRGSRRSDSFRPTRAPLPAPGWAGLRGWTELSQQGS